MSWLRLAPIAALSGLFIFGCASSQQKQRREQRERAVQSAKLYCEFLNGEQYPDLDVALNLAMAQKCDSEKSMSITSYKTPSEIPGIMFCCATHAKVSFGGEKAKSELPPGKGVKKEDKKDEKKDDKKDEELD